MITTPIVYENNRITTHSGSMTTTSAEINNTIFALFGCKPHTRLAAHPLRTVFPGINVAIFGGGWDGLVHGGNLIGLGRSVEFSPCGDTNSKYHQGKESIKCDGNTPCHYRSHKPWSGKFNRFHYSFYLSWSIRLFANVKCGDWSSTIGGNRIQ